MIADHDPAENGQDRVYGRCSWSIRHLPDGRGHRAPRSVPGHPAVDRRTATTIPGGGLSGCKDAKTEGGVCPHGANSGQIVRGRQTRDFYLKGKPSFEHIWFVAASSFFKEGMRIFQFVPVIIVARRSTELTTKPGFWKEFNKKMDLINNSTIIVRSDSSLTGGIIRYKVYVNGYIHGTPLRFADIAPKNSVYTRVASGHYRLVFKEFDQHKKNRLESNVLEFDLGEAEQITIWASIGSSGLELAFD